MVERSAVNRLVVGSNPTSGAIFHGSFFVPSHAKWGVFLTEVLVKACSAEFVVMQQSTKKLRAFICIKLLERLITATEWGIT